MPDACAIARQSGSATMKTTSDAEKSAHQVERAG
jgi:hypothetical protein